MHSSKKDRFVVWKTDYLGFHACLIFSFSRFLKAFFICVHVCAHMHMHMHVYHDVLLEVRGHFVGVVSLLLCGFQGLNLGHQTWWQGPLYIKPSSSFCY